jgi:hypothetical protein
MARDSFVGRNAVEVVPLTEETVEADFQVNIRKSNSPVTKGSTLEVTVDVENTGTETDTKTVTFRTERAGNSVIRDQTDVQVAGGRTEQVTLQWDTTGEETDIYTAVLETPDSQDTYEVEVAASTDDVNFQVQTLSDPDPTSTGSSVSVEAGVWNEGIKKGTQTVELKVNKV